METHLITSFLAMFLSANLVLCVDFYFYKKTYEALVSGEYAYNEELSGRDVHYFTKREGPDWKGIMYFADSGAIRLVNGGYLHNNLVMYFSPYSLYWYKKLDAWFKNNIENL